MLLGLGRKNQPVDGVWQVVGSQGKSASCAPWSMVAWAKGLRFAARKCLDEH